MILHKLLFLVRLFLLTVQLIKEDNMRIVSFTEARNGLKSVLDHVAIIINYNQQLTSWPSLRDYSQPLFFRLARR
jgi:hypothetical protein